MIFSRSCALVSQPCARHFLVSCSPSSSQRAAVATRSLIFQDQGQRPPVAAETSGRRNVLSAGQYLPQADNQGRQVAGDNHPQNVAIDLVVAMYKPIAKSDDLRPSDLRMRSRVGWDTRGCRFAHHLQASASLAKLKTRSASYSCGIL